MQQIILMIVFIAVALLCLCIFVPHLIRNKKVIRRQKFLLILVIIVGVFFGLLAIGQVLERFPVFTAFDKEEPISNNTESDNSSTDESGSLVESAGYMDMDEINAYVNEYILPASDIEYLVGEPNGDDDSIYDFSYGLFEEDEIAEIKEELHNLTLNNEAYRLSDLAATGGTLAELLFCNFEDSTPVSLGGFLKWYGGDDKSVWFLLGDDYCFRVESEKIDGLLDTVYNMDK